MRTSGKSVRGFTLTELVITLAIAGMLAVIGMPALGNLLSRTRSAGVEASIAGSLHRARNAAVMRGTRVVVCPSRDGRHCRTGDDWQHGWIVALDGDADGQPDTGTPIIATQPAMAPGTRIITSAGRGRIAFHPNGSAAGSNARFTICQLHAHAAQAVIVANSGRVRLANATPGRLHACLAGLH